LVVQLIFVSPLASPALSVPESVSFLVLEEDCLPLWVGEEGLFGLDLGHSYFDEVPAFGGEDLPDDLVGLTQLLELPEAVLIDILEDQELRQLVREHLKMERLRSLARSSNYFKFKACNHLGHLSHFIAWLPVLFDQVDGLGTGEAKWHVLDSA
jgi:hypothetical protein